MSRHLYYEELKELAREKRAQYAVDTARFGLSDVRKIYKREEIRIDYWPLRRRIKALYMCDDNDCSVAVQRALPDEPKLFALVHELKHHYRDRDALGAQVIACGDYNQNEVIEIGAEIFAAEFIYPEGEFIADAQSLSFDEWNADNVVHFKRSACKAKVSYTFICKRLEFANLIMRGQLAGTKFQKREEELYGVPFYKRRRSS